MEPYSWRLEKYAKPWRWRGEPEYSQEDIVRTQEAIEKMNMRLRQLWWDQWEQEDWDTHDAAETRDHIKSAREILFTQQLSPIEETVGIFARMGLIYVGVLEPPKSSAASADRQLPQILFRARQFGDDADRAITSFKSWISPEALEIHVDITKIFAKPAPGERPQ